MKTILLIAAFFCALTLAAQDIEYLDYVGKPVKEKYAVKKKVTSVVTKNDSTFYRVQEIWLTNDKKNDNTYLDKAHIVLHGDQFEYSRQGKLVLFVQYYNGLKQGKEISYYPSGKVKSVREYYHNVQMNFEKSYYESGALMDSVMYINGDRVGEEIEFFEDGSLKGNIPYSKGQLNGRAFFFEQNGDTSSITDFRNGDFEGLRIEFKHGKRFGVENLVADKLEGSAKYYYESGELAEETIYQNGTAVSCINYLENGTIRNRECENQLPPEYPGGVAAMKKFLAEHLIYPQTAVELGLQGKVFLKYVVKTDGSITDVKVSKGIPDCPECDAEAVRVVYMMPKWIVHPVHNRLTDVYYNLPVFFKLM